MRYRLCSLVAAGLIFCGVPGLVRAATIDCAPLRPGTQVDSTVEDTIKGQANILLRSLGSGSVENGYRQVESDTLARYPGADKLLLWREYIYVSCTLLAASSHWSDNEKWDKWMQLMNRWSAAPPTDSAPAPTPPPPPQPQPLANPFSAPTAAPAATQLAIGGVGLGTSLVEIQARKDINLSLDSDGTPYGEETFTFAYGLRKLEGDVVFRLRGDAVSSITVTHTLGSTSCADSATAATILNEKIHDWGTPLRRMVSAATAGMGNETTSYTFRRNDIEMVWSSKPRRGRTAGRSAGCR
jgi:hypothetical protein